MTRNIHKPVPLLVALIAIAAWATSPSFARPADALEAVARRCTMDPGTVRALLHVERDTVLPHAPIARSVNSFSGMSPSARDSMLAVPGTPLPGARVRLLKLDAATRTALATAGILDSQPIAFIRAAPYRADCQPIRMTDSGPWAVHGDTGYARGYLADREFWIAGVPVIVVPDAWNYPYPRQRGLAYSAARGERLAPAGALYDMLAAQRGAEVPGNPRARPDSAAGTRVLAWAQSNGEAASLEPIRSLVRTVALEHDGERVVATPSRLRGSYRVTMQGPESNVTWYFRTYDKPGYGWRALDSARTTLDVIASPFRAGYQLVGIAAPVRDSLLPEPPRAIRGTPLVWLSATDRPFAPGNDSQRTLRAELEFKRHAAPTSVWPALDAFVPPLDSVTREILVRMRAVPTRAEEQARLPLTLHLDTRGGVRADTSLMRNGQRLRVTVERIDTLSMPRRY